MVLLKTHFASKMVKPLAFSKYSDLGKWYNAYLVYTPWVQSPAQHNKPQKAVGLALVFWAGSCVPCLPELQSETVSRN